MIIYRDLFFNCTAVLVDSPVVQIFITLRLASLVASDKNGPRS